MADTSRSPDLPLFDFTEFTHLIGFEEVWEFESRWAREAVDGNEGRGAPA